MRLSFLNRLPFSPVVGALYGAVAAILVLATPHWLLERAVLSSGMPGLIPAAAPPLGTKASILVAVATALAVGALAWAAARLIERTILARPRRQARDEESAPAMAERIAPVPPRPIFAQADLGAPLMSDEAVAVAREELVLDQTVVEVSEADAAPVPAGTAISDPDEHPLADADDSETIQSLSQRLDQALERRRLRLGSGAPMPGDISSLKAALGLRAGG